MGEARGWWWRWWWGAAAMAALGARGAGAPPDCAANALCVCRADHFSCDSVPFYRFPDTEGGAAHVSVWAARLGALGEAALDARPLRTLVLAADRLHHLDRNVFASMVATLASLDLGYNEFTEIPIEALKDLRALNWLNMQNNLISDLQSDIDWGGLADSLSTLSLSNNQLCLIREGALRGLRHLAQLELDGNRLRHLSPRALPARLALLRLSHNLLPDVPCEALAGLPRLRHLHLRNNLLRPRPDRTDRTCRVDPPAIDSLDLSHNELSDGAHLDFEHGHRLKQLILDLNDFTAVPPEVFEFGRLERLSMTHNRISILPSVMMHVLKASLERLEVDHNKLTEVPQSIAELAGLRHLSVSYNELEDIEHLPPNLRSLVASGNLLSAFPRALRALAPGALLSLELGYNRIERVSRACFGAWSSALGTLGLRANRIAHLAADAFPALPLRELALGYNDLYHVDARVFSDLTRLRVLDLSSAFFGGDFPVASSSTLTWLKLDNNNVHYFSAADLRNFPSLEYLSLDFNKIIEFPSEATETSGSYKLRELRLSYNYVSEVNSEFLVNLVDLQIIDLSHNRIRNLSVGSFSKLQKLAYLNVASNEVEAIAEGAFSELPALQVLDLRRNRLAHFSARHLRRVARADRPLAVNASHNRIAALSGGPDVFIRVLDLSYNRLETVSTKFFDSLGTYIKQIFLSNNKIKHINSSTFSSLINLNILNLQNNSISVVQRRAFADMTSLQILDLSYNSISQLAVEQFHNLRQLRHLKLNGNVLRALPRDAFKNTLLEYLDLGENRLSLFPSSALSQVGFTLRRLELPANRLEYLDAAMLHATAFLHELNLARNALTVLSDNTLSGLPKLQRLDLSHNFIKANFKELFHNAPRLRRLFLAGVGLKSVPQLPLTFLTEIDLSSNNIASYGESDVRHLTNLRVLNISANKFTSLRPAMWGALPRLVSLDASLNPIVRIPLSAFESLNRLHNLRLIGLRHLETVEPKAFQSLLSLRSLSVELTSDPELPIAEMVSSVPHLEALDIQLGEDELGELDEQLVGLGRTAPKLRWVEVRGVRRVSARALAPLGGQRALGVRLGGALAALPAGLAAPLARVPHLTLDFSHNRLTAFSQDVLYPNQTGWSRYATKLLSGGLMLSGNPLRCGCASSWVGGWYRRWISEVGGDSGSAREAVDANTCESAGAARWPLAAQQADAAQCHASALSSRAPPRAPAAPAAVAAVVALLLAVAPLLHA